MNEGVRRFYYLSRKSGSPILLDSVARFNDSTITVLFLFHVVEGGVRLWIRVRRGTTRWIEAHVLDFVHDFPKFEYHFFICIIFWMPRVYVF